VPVPEHDVYEDFPQHENGIGMARAFYDELEELERGAGHHDVAPTGKYESLPAAPAEGYRAPRLVSPSGGGSPGGAGETGAPVVLLTGEYGAAVLEPVRPRLERLAGRSLRVRAVPNAFFGGNVAVSGLMVGEDLTATLAGDTAPAASYLIPDVTLSGDRFLDDMTIRDVAAAAPAPLFAVPTSVAGIVAGAQR
jgi:NifB/MoaA-like Fe-S oxidoreductase